MTSTAPLRALAIAISGGLVMAGLLAIIVWVIQALA